MQGRRDEVRRAIVRGIARGDIRKDAEIDVATELLVGPVYFRLMFGGELTRAFAERIVDTVLRGYASAATDSPAATTSPSAAAITSPAGGPRRG